MKVRIGDPSKGAYDVIVLPVFEDEPRCSARVSAWTKNLPETLLDDALARETKGKANELTILSQAAGEAVTRYALAGLGKHSEFTLDTLRQAAGGLARRLRKLKLTRLLWLLPEPNAQLSTPELAAAVVEGTALGGYVYDRFKSEAEKNSDELVLELVTDHEEAALIQAAVDSALCVAKATCWARDLINGPASQVTPSYLAGEALKLGTIKGLEVQVLEAGQMRALKMEAALAVAQGSAQAPRLVVLRYRGDAASDRTIAFVGKGITFDSGGLSLKTADGMETMKDDMSGAAAVFGAVRCIAALGLKVNVLGICPLMENMPSGSAYKPGDILRAMNGKTIEVVNTDAEGRVALADALAFAARNGVSAIVDLATLTGACVVALASEASGAMTNNDQLLQLVREVGEYTGERVWPLPTWSVYREMIDSDVADMKNSGGRWGGAITAAMFLKEFVGEIPWVHLDIAGPSYVDKNKGYLNKGGSGVGVRLLTELARRWAVAGNS